MSGDDQTLNFYDGEAAEYASWSPPQHPYPYLEKFLKIAPAGRVLDFGCGGGWAGGRMSEAGREVDAFDGSAELAAEARRLFNLNVTVGRFDEFSMPPTYSGIWAHFSLLHDLKANMPGNLQRLSDALLPGGVFYLGLKAGEGERRDRLGRFYAYYEEQELTDLLTAAGFENIEMKERTGAGFEGGESRLWHVFATRGDV